MRHATTLLAALAAALLTGCASRAELVPDDERVQAVVAGTGFSGAIVLGRAGRMVYARGIGLRPTARAGCRSRRRRPATGASIAKTFAAAAIHLLVAEGRLDLDDPVVRHVAEFPHRATRVRHLLAHSVGLPDYDYFDADFAPGTRRDTAAMLRVLAVRMSTPPFEPGSRFEYSSLGFDVAAMVVERVSGQPYTRFVQQRLFAPLGLRDSFARPAFFADWPGPRTLGYRERAGRWERFEVFDGEDFHGGSNWYVSALDLTRWAAAFARGAGLPPRCRARPRCRRAWTTAASSPSASAAGTAMARGCAASSAATCAPSRPSCTGIDRARRPSSTSPTARCRRGSGHGSRATWSRCSPALRPRSAIRPRCCACLATPWRRSPGSTATRHCGTVEFRVDKDKLSLHPAAGAVVPGLPRHRGYLLRSRTRLLARLLRRREARGLARSHDPRRRQSAPPEQRPTRLNPRRHSP